MTNILAVPQEALRAELLRKLAPKYATRLFQLRDIPNVMRSRLGWTVASALMERWFNGAPFRLPPEMKEGRASQYRLSQLAGVHLDETTVTMAWALRFARVQSALARLQANWATPAGVGMLKRRIANQYSSLQCVRFGDLSQPAKILDETCQVNYLVFGKWSDPLDDFYGAMGEAQMNVAVSGIVIPKDGGGAMVEIDELGFYLRDSYDFNDNHAFLSQPLGCWGFAGVQCGPLTRTTVKVEDVIVDEEPSAVESYKYLVQNADFQRWREKHQRGGDFMVLSDVLRVRLPFPQKFFW
ncbi:DUF6402 family protein [Acidovorax sp. NCPPB 3859]|nr:MULTISPECIES: DUF6402 family protein [unclassified Acidovorax]MDA8450967.1 DUF6402 family protein [Acidovorax sp. GBBC 3297]MDA8460412.1 DUF6402 family protein [Acidovorax sp. GBBC 3333]MDA8465448.1 DUF6402 family protein [Acidovorax sp. GBBC 3332]MDA8470555.1 DUF6402 family protein [Acidovorax sp. GBBC 3299]WCM78818.1 DUF6402 family protein [Acidovorax sp. GBBC 712]